MNVKGAEIDIRSIVVGDNTLSVLEIWGAEYQEQVDDDCFLSRVSGIENLTRLHSHAICLDSCFHYLTSLFWQWGWKDYFSRLFGNC